MSYIAISFVFTNLTHETGFTLYIIKLVTYKHLRHLPSLYIYTQYNDNNSNSVQPYRFVIGYEMYMQLPEGNACVMEDSHVDYIAEIEQQKLNPQ